MREQVAGVWFRSETSFGPMIHAHLHPGQENSGKLVTLVKQQARLTAMDRNHDLVLVDGPPGIGCPVISAASGADLALIVAEPTRAGVHDMTRVLETVDHFGVRPLMCINKADLYPEGALEVTRFCEARGIQVAGSLPFDPVITEAMVHGQPVTVYQPDSAIARSLVDLWHTVADILCGRSS